MAQAFVQPDSPLDLYLRETVKEENNLNTNHSFFQSVLLLLSFNNLNINMIKFNHSFFNRFQNLINKFKSSAHTNNTNSSETSPCLHSGAQLSERLKYLICSSFLLNPNLEPAFYNSQSSPPVLSNLDSFPSPTLEKPAQSSTQINSTESLLTLKPLFITLVSILVFFRYYLLSTFFLLILVYIFLLSSPDFQPLPNVLPTKTNPRETQFQIQSRLIPRVTQLLNTSQALDLKLSRAIGAVKEIECVALGFGLSSPMPPISRLENASFPFPSLSSPSAIHQPDFPHRDQSHENTLHALGVRKVLQRVLDQLRHDFETTASELESSIMNPELNSSESSSSSSTDRSTLFALMEMYGCARRQSTTETQTSLNNSATERARRRAWRASLHSENQENSSSLSNTSPNHFHLISPSPSSSSPRRLSWQTPLMTNNSTCETYHSNQSDITKSGQISLNQARSRPIHLATLLPQSLEHNFSRFQSSPLEDSHHTRKYPSARSRPLSVHITAPTSPPVLDSPNRSSLLVSSARSFKPRPASMYAALPHGPASSTFFYPSKSVDSYPNMTSEPPNHPDNVNLTEETPNTHRVIPYSLNALLNSFERMNISRKRLMCCLLALDFTLFVPPTSLNMWQDTLQAVDGLLKTVEDLSTELTNGMTSEFGPGSFETTPAVRSDLNTPSENFQVIDHSRHRQEEKTGIEVRDFGPPIPESDKRVKRFDDLSNKLAVMDRALRTITAKMKVCLEELDKEEQGVDHHHHGRRAITVHDSIRVDLECLAREWDESRSKIRNVVEGERVMIPGKNRLRNSLDSNEGSLSMSTSHGSSIYSSEILTPVSEDESIGLFETGGGENSEEQQDEEELEPNVSTIQSHQPMVPPPRLEEILRGVVMNETQTNHVHRGNHNRSGSTGSFRTEETINKNHTTQPFSSSSSSSSITTTTALTEMARRSLRLNTEESQELRKKRRESIPLTPRIQIRPRPHSLLSLPPSSSSSSSVDSLPSSGVVTELKDVLIALKSKRLSQQILS